jgi:hypothetical protein
MFKKQYIPLLKPPNKKSKTHIEHQVISKRDEERIKNIHNEQHKIRDMLNKSLQYRNDFLRSQRILNFQYEKSKLIALENKVVPNLRYWAPPIRNDDYPDAKDRLEQLELKMKDDLIKRSGPDFYNSRFY